MKKIYKQIVNDFSEDESILNSIIVSIFVKTNNITVKNNQLIKSLLLTTESNFYAIVNEIDEKLSFDDLINIFELAIPKNDVVVNGAVYTPRYIKEFIIDESFLKGKSSLDNPYSEWVCADISCGCGAFLYTLSTKIKSLTSHSYQSIFNNLYGFDICKNSIDRARILLSLLALSESEDNENFEFNLFVGNSLSSIIEDTLNSKQITAFDIIVGNPPYVRSKNIDIQTKSLLNNWSISSGNVDLYIPFFELGLTHLKENGVLGYITVNTFFKSINARLLRKYIQENKYNTQIIDFGQEIIFEKKLAYTCIVFIEKKTARNLLYTKKTALDIKEKCNDIKFEKIEYSKLDAHKGWLLNEGNIRHNISLIENAGTPLGEAYNIKNGLATLANGIFIFKPLYEDDTFYYFQNKNKEKVHKVEKNICRDIIKPNIIKTEHEIDLKKEKIIFPYENNKLYTEEQFKSISPYAYAYLSENRTILDNRDKGVGKYQEWFAFGRTQALTDYGKKLLLPYMSNRPYVVYSDHSDMLIYCGYAIYNDSKDELLILKKILESCVFDYYIRHTSKPYSTGYYSYAKNYIKYFGVYNFSDKEKLEIRNLNTKDAIDKYMSLKYGVNLNIE